MNKPSDPITAEPRSSGRKASRNRLLGAGLSIGGLVIIIAAFALVLPSIVSYSEVWDALRDLSWPGLVAVIVAGIINILTYGPSLAAALPGLPYPSAMGATLAASATGTVAPGGSTVGLGAAYVMLRAWGYRAKEITLALSLVTVWNQMITLSLPPLAIVLLWLSGARDPALERVAQFGAVVLVLLLGFFFFVMRSGAFARWVGDAAAWIASRALGLIRRQPVSWNGEQFASFREDAMHLIRKRWHWLTLGTIIGDLGVYLVLVTTLLAVGVGLDDVNLAESFAAFAIIRVLGGVPITPGGVGLVEVGLTAALISFGGDEAKVVAAVLVFRFMTVVVPLVCGGIAGAMWRRYHPGEGDVGGAVA